MNKLSPTFVALTVCLSLYASNSYANNILNKSSGQQCYVNVPVFDAPLVEGDANTLPINVVSNTLQASLPSNAIFKGNVVVTQGNRTVQSDQVTLNNVGDRTINLTGNIVYRDNLVQIYGDEAQFNLEKNDVEISDSQYHLMNRLGRGDAQEIQFTNNRYIVFDHGSFTSCPIGDNSWNVRGTTLIYDQDEELLEIWNAVFRVGPVPIFYSPYLQLPTGTKRRSGLLMPALHYDTIDGMDLSLPVYWNIAPNYDATFTPRIMQRRGVQLNTELRYLNELGSGTLAFDWLQHDRLYSQEQKAINNNTEAHRWLFHWHNSVQFTPNWGFHINTTRVSDERYLTDLGSIFASKTDGYLNQLYLINYANENWDINLNYRHFQMLTPGVRDSLYRSEPQLNATYYQSLGNFNFKTFSQVSNFISAGDKNPNAVRVHIEPSANYTLSSSWGVLNTEVGFMATHYDQDLAKNNPILNQNLKKDVNRFIPKASIDGKVIFDRDLNLGILPGYSQTVEPRIKYTYIPYRNQSDIHNYDSTLLQSDYIGLFRDMPYSGLDRIASANKIATGLTTRFYDDNKVERFNLSLGQIYYFTASKTGNADATIDKNKKTGSMTWAVDLFWRYSDTLIYRGGMQYDARINEIALANSILEYRSYDNKMLQFSYRYANKDYIDSVGAFRKQDISQFGAMSSWPLTENVSAVASVYYDVKIKQTVDSYVGLYYSDCCWGVGAQYGRRIVGWDVNKQQSDYKNQFSLYFELRGLNRNSNNSAKMLNFGLLPYTTAFE